MAGKLWHKVPKSFGCFSIKLSNVCAAVIALDPPAASCPPLTAVLRESLDKAGSRGIVTDDEGRQLWTAWMEACADLQVQLNDCTIFLAAFDVRKAQTVIDSLLETCDETKQRILPRKKFTFSKKPTGSMSAQAAAAHASIAATAEAGAISAASQGARGPSGVSSSTPASSSPNGGTGHAHTANGKEQAQSRYTEDEMTIENQTGQIIVIERGQFTGSAQRELLAADAQIAALAHSGTGGAGEAVPPELAAKRRRLAATASGRDLRLLSLTDCTILLLDPLKALRMDGLTRCTVLTGTVAGSVLLHNCEDCTFQIAARQLRLHTSTRCDLYLHCLSRPIIEHCTAFRFAPYGLSYEGQAEDMRRAGLEKPSAPHLWRSVDDFNWHRVQASPNWSVLPPGQRLCEPGGTGVLPPAAVSRGLTVLYPVQQEELQGNKAQPVVAASPVKAPVVEDDDEL